MRPIVIVAEQGPEGPKSGVLELAACAREISGITGGAVMAAAAGPHAAHAARELARMSGIETLALVTPGTSACTGESLKAALGALFKRLDPAHILISHTARGRDYGPGLAARLGGVAVTGITRVVAREGRCLFVRPVRNGKMEALVEPCTSPVVVTVPPGVFAAAPPGLRTKGEGLVRMETVKDCGEAASSVTYLGQRPPVREGSDLTRARVIVAGGRAMDGPEDLEILREMAALFPGGALGASRPVIDAGWLGHGFQVGITGAVVAPEVYLALGISGSTQHLAGIKGAGMVVAVNTDPRAAIFSHADLCVNEDFREFAREFVRATTREEDHGKTRS